MAASVGDCSQAYAMVAVERLGRVGIGCQQHLEPTIDQVVPIGSRDRVRANATAQPIGRFQKDERMPRRVQAPCAVQPGQAPANNHRLSIHSRLRTKE